jgi:hypothetical protein
MMKENRKLIYFSFFMAVIGIITLLAVVYISEAQNVTITFSDLDLTKDQKILIYNSTGHLVGEFNATDTVQLDVNNSYIMVIKPSEASWFSDPWQAINLLKATVPTYLSYLIFGIGAISGVLLLVRLFR